MPPRDYCAVCPRGWSTPSHMQRAGRAVFFLCGWGAWAVGSLLIGVALVLVGCQSG